MYIYIYLHICILVFISISLILGVLGDCSFSTYDPRTNSTFDPISISTLYISYAIIDCEQSVNFYPLTHPNLAKTKNQILLFFLLFLRIHVNCQSSVILAAPKVGDNFTLNLYNKVIPLLGFSWKLLLCRYFFFWLFTCICKTNVESDF